MIKKTLLKIRDFFFEKFKLESKSTCEESLDYKDNKYSLLEYDYEQQKELRIISDQQKEKAIHDLIMLKNELISANKTILELRNKVVESRKLPPPKVLRTLSKNSMVRNISRTFPELDIDCSDETYSLISRSSMEKFLADTKVDRETFKTESGDCDNFALELSAEVSQWGRQLKYQIAFGELWISEPNNHALNIFIYWDEETNKSALGVIEPQNDIVFMPTDKYVGRKIRI